MPAVEVLGSDQRIRRWDQSPSEFWEAVMRIEAELRYDPRSETGRAVRRTATGTAFTDPVKQRLGALVSQLPWLLPALECELSRCRSQSEGLQRIDHFQSIFSDACRLIDLREFRLDPCADAETRLQQIDALSRAMLLKSELLLILGQFELLRETFLRNAGRHRQIRKRFHAAA